VLVGNQGNDRLFGQAGRDLLLGGSGRDELNGGTGRDRLFGGQGNDRLIDRDGGDLLTGGQGKDEFWIGDGSAGVIKVQDFRVGQDLLKFMPLGITYEGLTFKATGRDTVISFQGEKLVRLQNVDLTQLNANSFEFGDVSLIPGLQAALESSVVPGAVLSVVTGDGSVWQGAAGLADLAVGSPMPVDARMDIGSITKTLTAVTTLQLMQEGRLSLDDKLSQWLPQVSGKIENSDTITNRQLLNHSSGIPESLTDDFAEAVFSDPSRIWAPEDFLAFVYGEPSEFVPGDRYGYSNTNYTLLGLIVEAASGDTLAGQIQSRIFDLLGMDDSSYVSADSLPNDFLRGYVDLANYGFSEEEQLVPVPFHPTAQGFGEGGAVSSVVDVTRFSEAIHNGELLAPETYQLMLQETAPAPGSPNRYGLGIDQLQSPFGPVVGYDGSFPGASSNMFWLPEQQVTVVTIENREVPANVLTNAFVSILGG